MPSRRHPLAAALAAVFALTVIPGGTAAQRVRIAVMSFENTSSFSYWGPQLGAAAADELVTQLVRSGEFSVIERQRIEEIMAEQNLGQTGRVNPATAAELGQVLGVQVVLMGSITQFSINTRRAGIGGIGGSYTEAESIIDVRAVSTTTAEILSVAEGEGKRRLVGLQVDDISYSQTFDQGLAQEALRPAVEQAVEELVEQVEVFAAITPQATSATIVGARDGSYYIDRGENFGIAVGQRFEVHRVVDEIRDAAGNILDTVTERVGVIEVTRVLSQSAICTVVEGEAAEGDTVRAAG